MTHLEKIDFVFFFIRDKISVGGNWGYHNIWNYVKETPESNINETLFKEIINKLKNDGFLSEISGLNLQSSYHVTFEGLIFDGYILEQEKLRKEDERLKSLEKKTLNLTAWTTILTIIIALGTLIAAIYYLLEILKFFDVY